MRDFRDAKAMARTLRAALAGKGLKISVSQSLELIAELFGVADWNTLAAAIRQEAGAPGQTGSRPARPSAGWDSRHSLSRSLVLTLRRALDHASERDHEYTTLEHLLLALIDDADAAAVMKACKVDLGALKQDVASFIDDELKALVADFNGESNPTPAFQRVVERAMANAQGLGHDTVTGADVLVAMFDEKESAAIWLLGEHEMTQQDAANVIRRRIIKGGEDPAA